jgi:AraC-like DNA-binding protein
MGREVDLGPGDVVIRDLRRTWEWDASLQTTLISVKVPAEQLEACIGGIDEYVAVPLRATNRGSGLLACVVENVGSLAFEQPQFPHPAAVSDLVFSALRIAYGTGTRGASGNEPEHPEVIQYIEGRIQDPCLNVAGLAAELGMSIRSFQRLFFQMSTTPRAYILSRRLELAAQRLRDLEQCHGARITEIALGSGFNDPGYFSRAFQKRFGMTPGEFLRRNRTIV